MTLLVAATVIVIVALIAGLAFYLFWAGTLLNRVGEKLEGAAELVRGIKADAELIGPGVEQINQTLETAFGAERQLKWASVCPGRMQTRQILFHLLEDFEEVGA